MNNKLFEKKLKPLSSKEFANITAKDEDWKYLGKKLFELNDIEIGKATDINSSKTFDIDSNCFTYEINSEPNHIEIIDINEIKNGILELTNLDENHLIEAKKYADKFTWDKVAQETIAVYKSVLKS